MHSKWYLFLLLCWSPGSVFAQDAQEMILEQLFGYVTDELEEEMDFTTFLEVLTQFSEQPLDINHATAEHLQELLFLSPLLIRKILDYREFTGGFISINELQAIDGMDLDLARLLSHYLIVKDIPSLQGAVLTDVVQTGNNDLMVRYGRVLEKSKGYTEKDENRSRYLGSPDRLMMRYRFEFSRDLKIALNLEKDPGEQFFQGAQRLGFDYTSFSLQLKNQGFVTNLVLGDFSLQFGQGLGLWLGYGLGKSSVLHAIAKQGAGIRPHTSFDEASFLRGFAGTLEWNRLALTPYFSIRRRDGNVQSDAEGDLFVASLSKSGLHRTPSEVRNKNAVSEGLTGMNVQLKGSNWRVGTNAFYTWYPVSIEPPPLARNHYLFRGSSFAHVSAYYHLSLQSGYFFGEVARSHNGGMATIHGAMLSVGRQLSLGAVYRYYQEHHHAPFGRPFGEGSNAANESGFYLGLLFQPSRSFSWVGYIDKFRFPWLKYRIDGPSDGVDILSQMNYSWTRDTKLGFRYRYKEKYENLAQTTSNNLVVNTIKNQLRFDFQSKLDVVPFSIRSRIDFSWFDKEYQISEFGWMFYQDVFYTINNGNLNLNGRAAYFHTTGGNTRLYVFESDLLYAHSSAFYQHKGWRMYVNARWRVSRKIDFWLKYAYSGFLNQNQIGSGLDLIETTGKSDLKAQFRFRF